MTIAMDQVAPEIIPGRPPNVTASKPINKRRVQTHQQFNPGQKRKRQCA
jgi:hypothetical protein